MLFGMQAERNQHNSMYMLIKVKCSTCQLALVWTMHAAYWNGDRMCSSFSRHIERTALCIYLIIHFYARMSVIVTMTKT